MCSASASPRTICDTTGNDDDVLVARRYVQRRGPQDIDQLLHMRPAADRTRTALCGVRVSSAPVPVEDDGLVLCMECCPAVRTPRRAEAWVSTGNAAYRPDDDAGSHQFRGSRPVSASRGSR